jgi:hypothetical protein
MIVIEQTIVSDDLIHEEFVCNLSQCKGACCEAGDMGAPLTSEEAALLDKDIHNIISFLSKEGKEAIKAQGNWVIDADGDTSTPLVASSGACAYAIKDEACVWRCGIEKAYEAGKSALQKPMSCHLYPVRIKQYEHYTAVNYHRWDICGAACELGKSLKVKVYQFLKTPLIRKFGAEWYAALEAAANEYGKD